MEKKALVKRDIARIKATLIRKVAKKGIYENFGQREVRSLESKYFDSRYARDGVWEQVIEFCEWCWNYTG